MTAPAQTPHGQDVVTLLRHQLDALPVAQRDEIWARLLEVAVAAHESGDIAPLQRYMGGLIVTSRLHSNRKYLKAVAEDEYSERAAPQPVNIAQMFTDERAARRP